MEQQYIDLYHGHQASIKKHSAGLMNANRDVSFEKFTRLGFPNQKHENYQYTKFDTKLSIDYGLNINRIPIPVNPYDVFKCDVPGIHSYLFFVVNDAFYPVQDPRNAKLPEGVVVGSVKQIAETRPELLKDYFAKLSSKQEDGFVAFNGAFAQDGFFMYVPAGVELDHPVQLVNIMRSDVDFMAVGHNVIILEKEAKAQLLVCDHTVDDVNFIANRVTEAFVGEAASFEYYTLENTHNKNCNLSNLFVEQNEKSSLLVNMLTLHNGLSRNNVSIDLNGLDCETSLSGLVIANKDRQVDNFTSVYHNKPQCSSHELFKYVLDDTARGVFTGKLYVAKDAQKTAAFQTNRNILLNKSAKMRTKPQLEIYADDVKCSHGATVGQLDETALFYLQQRGISKEEARLMLMFAFTSDVLDKIRIPALHDRMKMLVEKSLRGELSKCESCVICK